MVKLTDFITNPGFHPINERIFNHLNYSDLKNCCQVSNEIRIYIEKNSSKWKLFEKLQILKNSKRPNWTETILEMLGNSIFEHLESSAPLEELKIAVEFFEAWLTEKELHDDTVPVQFAIKYCVIEFVDFVNTIIHGTK